jgi:3-oxoacyl-(acyl-carrier-protein) synthase
VPVPWALTQAGLTPDDIDHVNAHGTGTELNDEAEARAISRVFGSAMPTVSTKGYTGHALGSAGAIEVAIAMTCLERGIVPVSLGAKPISTHPALDVVTETRSLRKPRVLSNSFAFGGSNVSVLIGRPA